MYVQCAIIQRLILKLEQRIIKIESLELEKLCLKQLLDGAEFFMIRD